MLLTPGHSPGTSTLFAARARGDPLRRDVLFQGSIGRTDLPYADHPTLERSLATLIDTLPPETTVYPGHMGITTLGRELATNPFLVEIRSESPLRSRPTPGEPAASSPDRSPTPRSAPGERAASSPARSAAPAPGRRGRQLSAADRIKAPRGTSDVLGEQSSARATSRQGARDPRGRRL